MADRHVSFLTIRTLWYFAMQILRPAMENGQIFSDKLNRRILAGSSYRIVKSCLLTWSQSCPFSSGKEHVPLDLDPGA